MKILLMAIVALGLAASPVLANECPLLHAQVMAAAGNRLDAAAYQAKMLAAEGDALHKTGKHAESVAEYEEAAKGIGLTLTHKAH
jgi:hypothetical protein